MGKLIFLYLFLFIIFADDHGMNQRKLPLSRDVKAKSEIEMDKLKKKSIMSESSEDSSDESSEETRKGAMKKTKKAVKNNVIKLIDKSMDSS